MKFEFKYSWVPFLIGGEQFIFSSHHKIRLDKANCSHWGPVIYKWEGTIIKQGHEHNGKTGVLIGETLDLRARLKQYATGTQPGGNLWWRNEFLNCGKVGFHILKIENLSLNNLPVLPLMESKNWRLILEQLLVLDTINSIQANQWLVNRMQ